tara:strand:+ start:163 stop:387 length:225 start_codon:yes stop_codon:yes gene_type:complete
MLVRMIIGKYVIGKGIVPFLRFLIEQLKRLEEFMFMYGTMKFYYAAKDRPYYDMLREKRLNDTRLIEIYGKENL